MTSIITTVGGSLIAIIGFFLNRLILEHDKTREMAQKNEARLDLMQNEQKLKYDHLEGKINELTAMIKDLAIDIKQITSELQRKSNN